MRVRNLIMTVVILVALAAQFVPTQSALAATCDWAQFIADVTVPDGKLYNAGETFDKTWRVKNIGTCTWTTDYSLVFVSGTQMGAPAAIKLPASVAPGQTVDLTVRMTAPTTSGTYRGNWQFRNAAGTLFGIGSTANKPFWVEIRVASGTTAGTVYDFVANAGSATWASGAGNLSFPGTDNSANGYVLKLDSPRLENGTTDSAPGLLTAPNNNTNGFIQGIYPEFTVQAGDRFQTIVNCEYNATSCYVNFRLEYQIGSGAPQLLWSFNERYEGLFYRANIDLSSLAGRTVKFILRANAAGSAAGDRALWGAPRIVRAGSGGVTVTPTTPTVTTTPGTRTPTPTPNTGCDRATFVSDVTIPDGSVIAPSTGFTKTWRIRNSGTCTWTTGYSLVFQSGERMGAPDAVAFPSQVAPGQTVDLVVFLTSPASNGTYRGNFILRNASGQLFGIGSTANKPFWVEIRVTGGSTGATVTPVTVTPGPSGSIYNFAEAAGSAIWSTGAGTLAFPGSDGSANGYAIKLDNPTFENGAAGGVSLITVPQNVYNGYIQGVYPAFRVQSGDRFRATVGCQSNATSCYVTYRLDYQIGNGTVRTFWSFRERFEGLVYNVDLDLSSLAGQDVKFILTILATGEAGGDRALWGQPRITRVGGATATTVPASATPTATTPASATPTPTATATQTPTATATETQTPTATATTP